MKKEDFKIDYWAKEIAPRTELRKWFGHDMKKWKEFEKKYISELEGNHEKVLDLMWKCYKNKVTLLYSTKNRDYNQAVIHKKFI